MVDYDQMYDDTTSEDWGELPDGEFHEVVTGYDVLTGSKAHNEGQKFVKFKMMVQGGRLHGKEDELFFSLPNPQQTEAEQKKTMAMFKKNMTLMGVADIVKPGALDETLPNVIGLNVNVKRRTPENSDKTYTNVMSVIRDESGKPVYSAITPAGGSASTPF